LQQQVSAAAGLSTEGGSSNRCARIRTQGPLHVHAQPQPAGRWQPQTNVAASSSLLLPLLPACTPSPFCWLPACRTHSPLLGCVCTPLAPPCSPACCSNPCWPSSTPQNPSPARTLTPAQACLRACPPTWEPCGPSGAHQRGSVCEGGGGEADDSKAVMQQHKARQAVCVGCRGCCGARAILLLLLHC
jgi:hypothetical protein